MSSAGFPGNARRRQSAEPRILPESSDAVTDGPGFGFAGGSWTWIANKIKELATAYCCYPYSDPCELTLRTAVNM